MGRKLDYIHKLQYKGVYPIIIKNSWRLIVVGILFVVLCASSASLAKEPTARISVLRGDVRVSGLGQKDLPATFNTVLSQGDAIQTFAGASAVLTFSEGSSVELGEHTTLYLAVLEQNPRTGARASHIHLLWGKIRAALTPKHQKKGSVLKVETVNAMVNVTFSQPDVEILYNWQTDTTIAFAHTVPLEITNLLTEETALIAKGHTGIVQGQKIEERAGAVLQTLDKTTGSPNDQQIRRLLYTFNETRRTRDLLKRFPLKTPQEVLPPPRETAHILGTPDTSLSPTRKSGVSETTIRIGSAVAIGGGLVAIAILSGDDGDDTKPRPSFTGTFVWEGIDPATDDSFQSIYTFHLTQKKDLITGKFIQTASGCCTVTSQSTVSGTVTEENRAWLSLTRTPASCTCDDGEYINFSGETFLLVVTLGNDNSLLSDGTFEYIRQ